MNKITLLITIFLLSACTTPVSEQQDCTGLTALNVLQFNKESHLFKKHDAKFYRRYGMETASMPTTILVQACQNIHDGSKDIVMYSNLWGRVIYCTQSVSDSLKTYDAFLHWAMQPATDRQKTLPQINQQLSATQCTDSTAPKSDAPWYADIEWSTQEPLLISNARNPSLHGMFSNQTVAFTADEIEHLRNQIFKYGEQK